MPEIRVLPRHLVNKIAAGEVIERPASVVKELLENALDADPTAVDVEVEDGGRRLIIVRDNGRGMDAEDLALAFATHATSKIASEEDLFNITSMGFRGEALASIGSISHASVVSRRRGSGADCGYEVRSSGDEIQPVRPAAAAEGTAVTVRDLFFNTPARRKFMRTAGTEFGHVVEQLARASLGRLDVAFTLAHNGRTTHRLAAGQDLRRRAAELFGAELAEGLLPLASDERGVKLSGMIAPPSAARASARWQYFFVNRRYVRDRTLAHALREAYRGLMEQSRSPVAFIFIEIDPSEVDVNVHPAKVEVRFRQGQLLHSQLLAVLRETLNKSDLAPRVAIDAAEIPDEPDDDRRRSLKEALADFFKSSRPAQARFEYEPVPSAGSAGGAPTFPAAAAAQPSQSPAATAEAPFPAPVGQAVAPPQPLTPAPRSHAIQVHDSYIVAATETGLAIIDQHALHERIIFEELSARLAEGRLISQRLLIPETIEASEADKALLAERADLLAKLGVEASEFGPNSVAINAFPSLLAERKVPAAAFLRDLLDLLAEDPAADGEALLAKVLSTMACKAAVKAGEPLTTEEIDALLARRVNVPRTSSCPHGRPTTLSLSLDELARQFKRT